MKMITAFPRMSEFEKMKESLNSFGLPYEVIDPNPGFSMVGCPAIALEQETRATLAASTQCNYISSGWVEYRPATCSVPTEPPTVFKEDIFGTASLMVVALCIADSTRIRIIAHISGDMSVVFPYLNTEMRSGSYNADGEIFSFMNDYRMITLYPRRISIAKADNIIDAWRLLEDIRCNVNDIFARRADIQPSYELRKKPPALEIYKRLPGINCRMCGLKTCMAFALTLGNGNAEPDDCIPIFNGDYAHLKDAFLEICAGLGKVHSDIGY